MVDTISNALAKKGETLKALETWKETMPTEAEMLPKDKYTMFDRKEKRYRKGIHSTSTLISALERCVSIGRLLTAGNRAPKVDESIAKSEPAWILSIFIIFQQLRQFHAPIYPIYHFTGYTLLGYQTRGSVKRHILMR